MIQDEMAQERRKQRNEYFKNVKIERDIKERWGRWKGWKAG
jgi:hypothetical protein